MVHHVSPETQRRGSVKAQLNVSSGSRVTVSQSISDSGFVVFYTGTAGAAIVLPFKGSQGHLPEHAASMWESKVLPK